MEEVDGLGDLVLDDHAACIAVDEFGGVCLHLVGEEQDGVVVSEVGDGDLAEFAGIAGQPDATVDDARLAIFAADVGQADAPPFAVRLLSQFAHHLSGALAQGEEVDAHAVEPGEVGAGGEAAVEDQFGGEVSGLVAIVLGEAENGVVLVLLADGGIGIAEQAGLGVAGEEGEDSVLAPGALGDVVLLDQRLVAVIGDGVEVEIEGGAGSDTLAPDGVVPRAHQRRNLARVDAGAVFGQEGALGHGVEASEQGEAGIEDFGHGLGGPADAPELEGEKGAPGACGRDLAAARHPGRGEQALKVEFGEHGSEHEQAAEPGAEGAVSRWKSPRSETGAASGPTMSASTAAERRGNRGRPA